MKGEKRCGVLRVVRGDFKEVSKANGLRICWQIFTFWSSVSFWTHLKQRSSDCSFINCARVQRTFCPSCMVTYRRSRSVSSSSISSTRSTCASRACTQTWRRRRSTTRTEDAPLTWSGRCRKHPPLWRCLRRRRVTCSVKCRQVLESGIDQKCTFLQLRETWFMVPALEITCEHHPLG